MPEATNSAAYEQARALALQMLDSGDGGSVEPERIRLAVEMAVKAVETLGSNAEIDGDRLVRDIEALVTVFVGHGSSLDDERDHQPWLPARHAEIEWRFWKRYRTYLNQEFGLPPAAVTRLDELTDSVLGRLEDPAREGPWDRRGMIVGQVQSGKTANYTGLICKAADAGYRLIIVLAGVHNSLRSQTQLRLDQGLVGFDTQKERMFDQATRRIGVGRLKGHPKLFAVNSMTNSEERGDFNLKVAKQVAMHIGSDPVLLVVKKNAPILRNVIKWATELQGVEHPDTGRMIVQDVPILVIDDEADHASVNTKEVSYDEDGRPDDDVDPTKINALIRELLVSFSKSAYVGYTATPFANIFAHAGEPSERYGDDLFPRSFITRLPPPSNHVGPAQVFGVQADPTIGMEARDPLPIVRDVGDTEDWIPTRHKKDLQPGPLPESLREAVHAFVLVCAARAARGHAGVHNSMLVHVTRFVNVQQAVFDQVSEEIAGIRDRLRYGEGAVGRLEERLRALWETDFEPTTDFFDDDDMPTLRWDDIRPHLKEVVGRIEVMRINGSAKDALTYYDHRDGLSVIAIGGDKLSRGLTLEGLSVSYFLRASRMYDTLMQMGRWFGYRPGYLDLCRLYIPAELRDWYRDITAANEELLLLFDEMAEVGGTPEDFGLRVRKSPDGLLVTARAKMRNGLEMRLSFDNSIVETIAFHSDVDVQARNLNLTERFIEAQGEPARSPDAQGNFVWSDVDGEAVAAFLADFTTHEKARKADGQLLAKYIRTCIERDELTAWTVGLISNAKGEQRSVMGGHDVGLTKRSALDDSSTEAVYRVRRVGSPSDEALDLGDEERAAALERTRRIWERDNPTGDGKPPEVPNGPSIRAQRARDRGLLLIYPLDPAQAYDRQDPRAFADGFPTIIGLSLSFPESPNAPTVEYVVNNVHWQMEMGLA